MSGDQKESLSFHHTGRSVAMIGLCLKIFLLSLVTLTIYRFWGRTEVRRYLWGHTVVDGEPLDYLGKGGELFIGFLIALFVYLFPLGIAINAIFYIWPPDERGGMQLGAVPWVFLLEIGFVYLVMVGLYQALRYRFSRTAWRGIRFSLHGSAFVFGLMALLLMAANILCLGLLTPVVDLAIFRRIARNTHFGDKAFGFEGKARRLYGPFLVTYVLVILLFVGFGACMTVLQHMVATSQETGLASPESVLAIIPYIYAGLILISLAMIVATSFYAASSLRVKGSGMRFQGLSFTLEARTLSYLWLTISNIVLLALTLGIAVPIAELRRFRYIFRRLSTDGSVDLTAIGQSTGPRPRFGEGLAEAFGMGNV